MVLINTSISWPNGISIDYEVCLRAEVHKREEEEWQEKWEISETRVQVSGVHKAAHSGCRVMPGVVHVSLHLQSENKAGLPEF